MPWSDDDAFESADEGSHDGATIKDRKKRLSSSNYSESANDSDQDMKKSLPSPPPPKPVEAKKELPKQTADGWDDFEVEEPEETETKPNPSSTIKSPQETSKNTKKEQDTGWDDFDNWGDDKTENESEQLQTKYPEPIEPTKQTQPLEPDIRSIAERLSATTVKEEKAGGWGWSSWGVDSLLSTATAGISTITNHVSQGITTVLENGIGAPGPEELARNQQTKTIQNPGAVPQEPKPEVLETRGEDDGFQFGNLISGVTKFVETTGTKVIAGGLDTLETIGKKTMEVLQDGDPGLVKKRVLLGLDPAEKVVLSQVLREAKSKADEEDRLREEKREAKEVHYETLFDDFEGLVHLEALEMLSRQVSMRIEERLRAADGEQRLEIRETLQQVAELCEMPEDEEDEEPSEASGDLLHERLQEATRDLGLQLQFQPLVKQFTEVLEWFSSSEDVVSEKAVYKFAVSSLAACTARGVQLHHKAAALLLAKPRRSTADEADALAQMTAVLTKHISELATKFTAKLNSLPSENKEQINTYITNVFLEAGNSSTYIQNAFHLALPILQIGAV